MKCKIKDNNNNIYISPVFAFIENGFYSKVIVFDNEKKNLVLMDIYQTKFSLVRQIFIYDSGDDQWASKAIYVGKLFKMKVTIKGYDWIINNINLDKLSFSSEIINKAKELDKTLIDAEWNYVTDEKSKNELLSFAWGFHDSYIKNINIEGCDGEATRIIVEFDGCWNCSLKLVFEGNVKIRYSREENYSTELFCASILFNDKNIIFVNENIKNVEDITDNMIMFSGEILKWKSFL